MPGEVFLLPFRPGLTANAIPIVGARLEFYASGTSTPQPVYADEALTVPLGAVVIANSAGVWPTIYLDLTKIYRAVLRSPDGEVLREADPYVASVVDNLAPEIAQNAAQAIQGAALASAYATALVTYTFGYIGIDNASPPPGVGNGEGYVYTLNSRVYGAVNNNGAPQNTFELLTQAAVLDLNLGGAVEEAETRLRADFSAATGAGELGTRYPFGTGAAARPLSDKLADRMPSVWDFYRPDLGDTLDDWAPQLNRAFATGLDIHLPAARRPQGYTVNAPITQAAGGQMLYGDDCGSEINIPATFPLDVQGVLIIPSNTQERGCGVKNLGFRFEQPDTAERANLIQYPPAIYARNVARMRLLGRVTVYLGYKGLDLTGNNGGLDIDTLRLGCFHTGLLMDGAYDKTNISSIELWPYGCGGIGESAGLYSIYRDGVAKGIELGRVDGFSVNSLKTFQQRIVTKISEIDMIGTEGFGTIGELHLDGTYGRLEMNGGKLGIGTWYGTTGSADDFLIRQTGGVLSLGPCGLAIGAGTAGGGQAMIQVSGGRFNASAGGFYEAVPTGAALLRQTGGDVIWMGGNIASGFGQVRTEPFFDISGGRCTLKNPRFVEAGGGSGLAMRVTNEDWHDIEINALLSRGYEIPPGPFSGTYKFGSTTRGPAL